MLSAAAVAATLCSVAVAASTAGGSVHDPDGFGPHGRLATIGGLAWPSGQERTAVTGDGRIYVAATPGPSGAPEAVRVRRYLPDGEPDPSFGIAGSVVLAGALGDGFRLDELLVDTNGLPYLVGSTGSGELVVARLDDGGALDPTYGEAGLARLGSLPSAGDPPRATIDQGNRVVVAAAAVVDRLTLAGALDPTFGTNGAVPLPDPDVEGLGVDEEGRVQLALPGEGGNGFRQMRLGPNGGPRTHAFRGIGAARAMAVRSDGATLVVGTATKRTGDGVTVPLLRIGARGPAAKFDRRVVRSSVRLRGRGDVKAVVSDPSGDVYVVADREILDLSAQHNPPFGPSGAYDYFGRAGRVLVRSSGELVALGATITDSDGTLLADGIARPRRGSPADGFLAKFPTAEHVITYAPESMGG